MKLKLSTLFIALLLITACDADKQATSSETNNQADVDYIKTYSVKGDYEDVWEDIQQAITDRGFVINNVSHIGDMLERTGKDIGASKKIYIKAESLDFCSAVVSRRTMEADPHNINFCPYLISVYVIAGEPDTVYVSFRPPKLIGSDESKAALKAVGDLLDEIVKEVVE